MGDEGWGRGGVIGRGARELPIGVLGSYQSWWKSGQAHGEESVVQDARNHAPAYDLYPVYFRNLWLQSDMSICLFFPASHTCFIFTATEP